MHETLGLGTIFSSKIDCVPNHIARRVGPAVQRRIDALKIGQKMQDLPEELWHKSFYYYVKEDPTRQGGPNLRMLRLHPEQPSLTVTGYIFNKFVHPFENRFITVREAARLQGIPDTLKIEGTLTSTQLQVGNIVPIPLAKAVFEAVLHFAAQSGFNKPSLTAFSLFSGAGGMDIGAEQAKHPALKIDTKLALDNWYDACETLRGFYKNSSKVLETDILQVKEPLQIWQEFSGESEPPDLIYGGPPCQAFSQAGKQKGLNDSRGQLILEFLRFVEALKPRFFVMENVNNLKGTGNGFLYQQILQKISDLDYKISTRTLLAADFGTPQLRHRLFFVGSRSNVALLTWPEPTHQAEATLFGTFPYVTVGEAFTGLPDASFSDQNKLSNSTN
jgi:DNA (cytosine-5)-methyltransferase 1